MRITDLVIDFHLEWEWPLQWKRAWQCCSAAQFSIKVNVMAVTVSLMMAHISIHFQFHI